MFHEAQSESNETITEPHARSYKSITILYVYSARYTYRPLSIFSTAEHNVAREYQYDRVW